MITSCGISAPIAAALGCLAFGLGAAVPIFARLLLPGRMRLCGHMKALLILTVNLAAVLAVALVLLGLADGAEGGMAISLKVIVVLITLAYSASAWPVVRRIAATPVTRDKDEGPA